MNLAVVLACVVALFSFCHIPRFTIVALVFLACVVAVFSFCHIPKLTIVTLDSGFMITAIFVSTVAFIR